MGLGSKMSAEMGLLAFTALLGCFEASTSVRAPPIRLAIMRAPGPAQPSPHAGPALLSPHIRPFGLCIAASAIAQRRGATLGLLAAHAAVLVASVQDFVPLRPWPLTCASLPVVVARGRCGRRGWLRGGSKRTEAGRAVVHRHSVANRGAGKRLWRRCGHSHSVRALSL